MNQNGVQSQSGWQGLGQVSTPVLDPSDPTAQILNSQNATGPYMVDQTPSSPWQQQPSAMSRLAPLAQTAGMAMLAL